jgi:hypothetical protein
MNSGDCSATKLLCPCIKASVRRTSASQLAARRLEVTPKTEPGRLFDQAVKAPAFDLTGIAARLGRWAAVGDMALDQRQARLNSSNDKFERKQYLAYNFSAL